MGALFCLLSAAGFGAMAVFGKLSYDAGVSVDALLLVRFGLAGAVLLAIALARGALRNLPRTAVLAGLGMGVFGYAAQAGLYFSALARIDASLVALILYVYPVLVMAGAVVLRRERASRRRVWALGLALVGIGLVLSGAATGRFDMVGALLALGAAIVYTGYILVGDRVDISPLALAALVCTGAFGTFLLTGLVRGGTDLGFAPAGWLWLGALALVSTVAAILLFFAGMARVGPSVASILSILEPVVTVIAAAVVFGEVLTPIQWLGGALVLSAVLIVQWPSRSSAQAGRAASAQAGRGSSAQAGRQTGAAARSALARVAALRFFGAEDQAETHSACACSEPKSPAA
ncbi:DMT family transporter [Kribbella sp. NPDC050241]|uniref:DMT family transporter n=1 Tax=Kribbella sp. NPDC050241 TaxID=3364115 RepID=UPI0037B8AFD2